MGKELSSIIMMIIMVQINIVMMNTTENYEFISLQSFKDQRNVRKNIAA
jgi:hypothetical protein